MPFYSRLDSNALQASIAVLAVREPFTRALLERILRSEGMEVIATGCADDAVAAARRTRPTVVLVDIELPSAQGDKVLQRLNESGLARRTVVLSASGSTHAPRLAMSLGMSGFLSKPFRLEALLGAVRCASRNGAGAEVGA